MPLVFSIANNDHVVQDCFLERDQKHPEPLDKFSLGDVLAACLKIVYDHRFTDIDKQIYALLIHRHKATGRFNLAYAVSWLSRNFPFSRKAITRAMARLIKYKYLSIDNKEQQ